METYQDQDSLAWKFTVRSSSPQLSSSSVVSFSQAIFPQEMLCHTPSKVSSPLKLQKPPPPSVDTEYALFSLHSLACPPRDLPKKISPSPNRIHAPPPVFLQRLNEYPYLKYLFPVSVSPTSHHLLHCASFRRHAILSNHHHGRVVGAYHTFVHGASWEVPFHVAGFLNHESPCGSLRAFHLQRKQPVEMQKKKPEMGSTTTFE